MKQLKHLKTTKDVRLLYGSLVNSLELQLLCWRFAKVEKKKTTLQSDKAGMPRTLASALVIIT